jgi:hypothetical protein
VPPPRGVSGTRCLAQAAATLITSASSRAATMMSADLPLSCSLRIGLYQKKSRERLPTTLASVITGTSPNSASTASMAGLKAGDGASLGDDMKCDLF